VAVLALYAKRGLKRCHQGRHSSLRYFPDNPDILKMFPEALFDVVELLRLFRWFAIISGGGLPDPASKLITGCVCDSLPPAPSVQR
jgi:hypothetical protein